MTTADGKPNRKCRAECIDGKPHSECNCLCDRACHGQGDCNPERHGFDANNFRRRYEDIVR